MARLKKSKSKVRRKEKQMIINVLLAEVFSKPACPWPAITILVVDAVISTLFVIGLIRLVKFLGSAPKEQKLLRMELGKLAEEVHQIRNELKSDNKQQS
jgi:hypothetical protein